jgi:hypothetical protein
MAMLCLALAMSGCANRLGSLNSTVAAAPAPVPVATYVPPPAPVQTASDNDTGVAFEKAGEPAVAATWYQRGAEQGDPDAECNLGALYARGSGVAQSDQLASEWTHKSADQGNPRCMYFLGLIYARGVGEMQSAAMARSWFDAVLTTGDLYYVGLAKQQLAALPVNEPTPVSPAPSTSVATTAPCCDPGNPGNVSGVSGAANPPDATITARYDDGAYYLDGSLGGTTTSFLVDSGATQTVVDMSTLERAGLKPVGMGSAVLANGSVDTALIYIVPRLCVGTLCASNIEVSAGVQALLGPDFLRAAQAKETIVGNTLTLEPADEAQ